MNIKRTIERMITKTTSPTVTPTTVMEDFSLSSSRVSSIIFGFGAVLVTGDGDGDGEEISSGTPDKGGKKEEEKIYGCYNYYYFIFLPVYFVKMGNFNVSEQNQINLINSRFNFIAFIWKSVLNPESKCMVSSLSALNTYFLIGLGTSNTCETLRQYGGYPF